MRILETTVCSPTSVEEAWGLRESSDESTIFIAGGTFLQTKWEKGSSLPETIIHLEEIPEYQQIYLNKSELHIGAFSKLAQCKNDPLVMGKLPQLSKTIEKIAAPAVRNLGTIGGNIANRVGDTIPLLLVLEAEVLYLNKDGKQRTRLEDWLRLKDDSLILEVIIADKLKAGTYLFSQKVGRREAFSASVVTLAGLISVKGKQVSKVRLGAGGGETRPSRLRSVESLLEQALAIDEEVITKACKALIQEYQPVEDAFYSQNYRLKVASNLLMAELANRRGEYGGI